jgi:hypothetical protein
MGDKSRIPCDFCRVAPLSTQHPRALRPPLFFPPFPSVRRLLSHTAAARQADSARFRPPSAPPNQGCDRICGDIARTLPGGVCHQLLGQVESWIPSPETYRLWSRFSSGFLHHIREITQRRFQEAAAPCLARLLLAVVPKYRSVRSSEKPPITGLPLARYY